MILHSHQATTIYRLSQIVQMWDFVMNSEQ
jgi:hypothetical protein